jgi:hypothetical protein
MADVSITASAVLAAAGATTKQGTAGATVTAGQVVYQSPTTKKYLLADADSATASAKVPAGIALNGASDGQPLMILTSGDLTVNAVLTAGTAYYLSPNPGGVAPLADIASGDNVVLLGLAKSTTVLGVDIQIPGVTL